MELANLKVLHTLFHKSSPSSRTKTVSYLPWLVSPSGMLAGCLRPWFHDVRGPWATVSGLRAEPGMLEDKWQFNNQGLINFPYLGETCTTPWQMQWNVLGTLRNLVLEEHLMASKSSSNLDFGHLISVLAQIVYF